MSPGLGSSTFAFHPREVVRRVVQSQKKSNNPQLCHKRMAWNSSSTFAHLPAHADDNRWRRKGRRNTYFSSLFWSCTVLCKTACKMLMAILWVTVNHIWSENEWISEIQDPCWHIRGRTRIHGPSSLIYCPAFIPTHHTAWKGNTKTCVQKVALLRDPHRTVCF